MKKIIWSFALLASGVLYAGAIKDKYLEVNDKFNKMSLSEDVRKKILDENVNRALKMTLLEQYNLCNYEKAQVGKENYEVSDLNSNLVYVQYQSFVGYYIFGSDPERFLQYPADFKILLEPGAKITRSYEAECTAGSKQPVETTSNK